ncbi:MAG: PRC-barrel domain-containing protein [Loktanella sp.]|nr:PRC-barrel domain-containing protein [Loktanella sp.]
MEIEESDPSINIESGGEGDVDLTQEDAEVDVEQAEGAEVDVDQPDAAVNVEEMDEAETEAMEAESQERLIMFADMTASDLEGQTVYGTDGDEVGEIENVVRASDGLAAVVGVGGFLGLGEHRVAIPMDRLTMTDGQLMLQNLTDDEIRDLPAYNDGDAEELEGNFVLTDEM